MLDTTSSMSGLIQAAKEKIWSIATSMASARQNPEIHMGLVAFRDRGDAYITRVYDLSSDLDSMYASLMDFRAEGGGDGPRKASTRRCTTPCTTFPGARMTIPTRSSSWSATRRRTWITANDVKYPVTLEVARQKGIVVNAIQSGQHQYTRPAWQQIAALGQGEYFQVENSGNAVAIATPYDEKLSKLAAELRSHAPVLRRYRREKGVGRPRIEANARLRKELSSEALARRDSFNATESGKANLLPRISGAGRRSDFRQGRTR